MSPTLELRVQNVVYDKENGVMFLEVVQKFHIRLSPLRAHWSRWALKRHSWMRSKQTSDFQPERLIVRLTLREIDGLHYIAFQEDFYHPDVSYLLDPNDVLLRFILHVRRIFATLWYHLWPHFWGLHSQEPPLLPIRTRRLHKPLDFGDPSGTRLWHTMRRGVCTTVIGRNNHAQSLVEEKTWLGLLVWKSDVIRYHSRNST